MKGGELNAIERRWAALSQMIDDTQDIFLILRDGEPEIAVRAYGIVVADDRACAERRDRHHGIQGRAKPAGITVHIKRLPFVGSKAKVIHLDRLGDDSIERRR